MCERGWGGVDERGGCFYMLVRTNVPMMTRKGDGFDLVLLSKGVGIRV